MEIKDDDFAIAMVGGLIREVCKACEDSIAGEYSFSLITDDVSKTLRDLVRLLFSRFTGYQPTDDQVGEMIEWDYTED